MVSPAYASRTASVRKRMLWISCFGCLLMLGTVVWITKRLNPSKDPQKAAAEAVLSARLDFVKVRADDQARAMIVKMRGDEEERTVSYAELALGKLPMRQAGGTITVTANTDLSQVPAWVPRLPGNGEISGAFHQNLDDRISGMIVATCSCDPQQLEQHLASAAAKQKLSATKRNLSTFNGNETRTLTFSDEHRELRVNLYLQHDKPLNVQIGYTEMKPSPLR